MFWLTMGYETHPNDSQQVFVDLFLYTTVVKWTRKNKNVFVYVKCFYVTVSLSMSYIVCIHVHFLSVSVPLSIQDVRTTPSASVVTS